MARYLRRRGAGAEVLVGIMVERSIEMVVGLLGILKSGAAYVPFDPKYPAERLRFMLEDAQVSVLLIHERTAEMVPQGVSQLVSLDGDWAQVATEVDENLENSITPDIRLCDLYLRLNRQT